VVAAPKPASPPELAGTVLVLVSATAFGTLAILVKLAYRAGLSIDQVLAFRFGLAGVGMLVVAAVTRQSFHGVPRRRLAALVAMGLTGYSGQSLTFFLALTTLPASLVELILYSYPALVALAAWAIYKRRIGALHGAALVATFAGVALLVGGIRFVTGPGLVFAVAAPLIYTAYILLGDYAMRGTPPLLAGTVVTVCAAVVFLAAAEVRGQLRPPSNSEGWIVLVGVAVVPTMLALTTFLAGLSRVGAARAALLSTWEPVVTVVLAIALLGDRFSPPQVVGAVLVLGSVIALQWRGRPLSRR
jgi:drug/metabolite transporter (DMT)-like permease